MNVNLIKESARGYQALGVTDVLFQNREIFLTREVNAESCAEIIQQLIVI